ncbi:hypothetical protein AKO1_015339 [Acrasis kona]|uniref:Transmembrane protein n=1 Tax=Acrasis kona TaxID=1008807 RepID=A0AAW2ZFR2_9EUKA
MSRSNESTQHIDIVQSMTREMRKKKSTSEKKEGKVPRLQSPIHIICMIMNILLSGTGTLIAAFCTKSTHKRKWNVLFALLQFLLAPFIVGWVWSAVYGVIIFNRTRSSVANANKSS